MHYDIQHSARKGSQGGKHAAFWSNEPRLPITDPIWEYVKYSAKCWGTDNTYGREGEHPSEGLLRLAQGYMERDEFERVALEVIRLTINEAAWDVCKFGGSPGGEPYMETTFTRHESADGRYVRQTFFIALGLTENYNADGSWKEGTRWYVDFKTEGGDVLEYVYLEHTEMTPARLVGWYRHMKANMEHYPFQKDFEVGDNIV
jgi:hypothetical protein